MCSDSNSKYFFKKCSIFQELNFCLKGRSQEPPSSTVAKPSPNYYSKETETAALHCWWSRQPEALGFYEAVVWCPAAGLCLETVYQCKQCHVCASPLSSASLHLCYPAPCSPRALLSQSVPEPRPAQLPGTETLLYSPQNHSDGGDTLRWRPPHRFTSPLQFLYAKCGSLLWLGRKTREIASAWGSEMLCCCKSPLEAISALMHREQRQD